MQRIAVVTGGSSGIGRETAELLVLAGYKVYELSRSGKGQGGVIHITADMTDRQSVEKAFAEIPEPRLDLLICNAGMGISGAVEYTDIEDARYLFNVNFFGAALAVSAARPRLNGGRIIMQSSVAAVLPIPFQAYYSASKAAVNAMVLCLRNELGRFGISVCAMLPGDVSTGFTAARKKSEQGDGEYGGVIKRSVGSMEKDEVNGMSPRRIAECIVRLAGKRRVKPFYSCGAQYKLFCVLSALLPRRLSNYIVGKMYS